MKAQRYLQVPCAGTKRFKSPEARGIASRSCRRYLLENDPSPAVWNVAGRTSPIVKEVPALSRANCLSPPTLANTLAELPGVRREYLNGSYGKRWGTEELFVFVWKLGCDDRT